MAGTKTKNENVSKDQERAELHRTIWRAANDLVHGGAATPVEFMSYVFGGLFYRYISENLSHYINEEERRAGKKDFDYAALSDKEAEYGRAEIVKSKGFYILPSELFENVRQRANQGQESQRNAFEDFPKYRKLGQGRSERARHQGAL